MLQQIKHFARPNLRTRKEKWVTEVLVPVTADVIPRTPPRLPATLKERVLKAFLARNHSGAARNYEEIFQHHLQEERKIEMLMVHMQRIEKFKRFWQMPERLWKAK